MPLTFWILAFALGLLSNCSVVVAWLVAPSVAPSVAPALPTTHRLASALQPKIVPGRRLVQLNRSEKRPSEEDENAVPLGSVRFLGRGSNAIVRPGCVLIAPSNEFHHYYRRSAIFIHAMGEDPREPNTYIIRGLIIDHPTPFTLREMMEHNPDVSSNPMGDNFLFRGGDIGKDGVVLLHNQGDMGQNEIGTSGIYEGGWQAALDGCAKGTRDAVSFKAFFNHCEFTEKELEQLLGSEEDGDAWASVEVEPHVILDADWDRGDAWKRIRNTMKEMKFSQNGQ